MFLCVTLVIYIYIYISIYLSIYIYNQSVICNINLQVTNQDKPILFRNDSVLEQKKKKKKGKKTRSHVKQFSELYDGDKLCELCEGDKL